MDSPLRSGYRRRTRSRPSIADISERTTQSPTLRPSTISTLLTELDVLRLRFRNVQLGLEAAGHGHARQVGPGGHALPDLDRHDLEHALDAGADLQGVRLALAEVIEGFLLGHACLFGLDLRLD